MAKRSHDEDYMQVRFKIARKGSQERKRFTSSKISDK